MVPTQSLHCTPRCYGMLLHLCGLHFAPLSTRLTRCSVSVRRTILIHTIDSILQRHLPRGAASATDSSGRYSRSCLRCGGRLHLQCVPTGARGGMCRSIDRNRHCADLGRSLAAGTRRGHTAFATWRWRPRLRRLVGTATAALKNDQPAVVRHHERRVANVQQRCEDVFSPRAAAAAIIAVLTTL